MNESLARIGIVAEALGDLRERVVFVGGAVLGFLVTDPGFGPVRTTDDVDVAVEIASRVEYHRLDAALRQRGFVNAMGGPICRYLRGPVVLDAMPADPGVLGFANRWYPAAMRSATTQVLDGLSVRVIRAPEFLATKWEAFDSPSRENGGDPYGSRDFEDVVAVLDGRPGVEAEIAEADPEVRAYLAARFALALEDARTLDAVEGHLPRGAGSRRGDRTLAIMERVAESGG